MSRRLLQDPRFREVVQMWVTDLLPREWLIAQCRQLATTMADETARAHAMQPRA
jgi:hypothetical protein